MKTPILASALLLGSIILSSPALASPTDRILLVSRVGTPTPSESKLVDDIVAALGDQAPAHGSTLQVAIERSISFDAGPVDEPTKPLALIKSGRSAFLQGNYRQAILALSSATRQLAVCDALLARDQQLRGPLQEALFYLAHAHLRANETTKAVAVVTEAIRSFPDNNPNVSKFAPDLVQLYRRVSLELKRQSHATLTIRSAKPGCLAFVNGRYIGITPTKARGLLPGKYRVYLQRPGATGRVHVTELTTSNREITIEHGLDAAIVTSPRVGLSYASDAEQRAHEHAHAIAIGRAVDAQEITIIGFVRHMGRRVVQGQVLGVATGRVLRSALLATEPAAPTPAETKALARFLLSGQAGDGVIIGPARPLTPTEPPTTSAKNDGFFRVGIWKWITLGVGVASAGAGIALIALDGKGSCGTERCPDSYNTLAPGIILTAVGGAALITSVVLFIVDAKQGSSEKATKSALFAPWAGRRSAGLLATWQF